MKLLTRKNRVRIVFIAVLLIFQSNNLSAQYSLGLAWQKIPGELNLNISSISKSDDDSLIYVASANRIRTIRAYDGETVKIDTIESTYCSFLTAKGEKTASETGDWGGGMIDQQTFKRIYWDSIPYGDYNNDFRTLRLKDRPNRVVLCNKSYVLKRESYIRVYDVFSKTMLKDYNPEYSKTADMKIKIANVTDDGKYIIYGYETFTSNPNKTHYFLRKIDLEGNLMNDFDDSSPTKLTFTIDGKR